MKLNADCMRAVLLEMEKMPLHEELSFKKLKEALPKESSDDIEYSIIKMQEAGFITARIVNYDDGCVIMSINDITYHGHQFLETIRDNKVWSQTKTICGKIGSFAIDVIAKVASEVISNLIKQQI